MDQKWLDEFNKRYAELVQHLVSGMEKITSESLGPGFGEMLGRRAMPRQVPLEACYRILGLSSGVSWKEVQHRYRELSKRLHPDVAGPETAHLFTMVTAAYEQIRKQKEEVSQ